MAKAVATVVVLLLIVAGAGAAFLLIARSEPSTSALDADLADTRAQIKAADAEDAKYADGAIKALISIRREILQTTEAMLEAKRSSLIRRIDLAYEIDGRRVRPANDNKLSKIARDIDKEKAALSIDIEQVSRYSGGLIQTMSLMAAATDRVTIAQLELAYYAAKYGSTFPLGSPQASPEGASAPGKIVATSKLSKEAERGPMRSIRYAAFVVIAAGLGAITVAWADDNALAPFGLQWGMSSAQARAIGVVLTEDPHKNYGITYVATKLPKMIADVETVLLSFGFDDKLWRVVALSKEFSNDPYGSAVQKRYRELAAELAEKYGMGETKNGASDEFYGDPKNFVYAIQSGNAWCYTNYQTNLISIQLGIVASDTSTAMYRIIFENDMLRSDFDKGKKAYEKKAL